MTLSQLQERYDELNKQCIYVGKELILLRDTYSRDMAQQTALVESLKSQCNNVGLELILDRNENERLIARLNYLEHGSLENYKFYLNRVNQIESTVAINGASVSYAPLQDLVYVHLTKTGGGSLQRMINISAAGMYFVTSLNEDMNGRTTDGIPSPSIGEKILTSHSIFQDLQAISKKYRFFTFLRSPIDHRISHFCYEYFQNKNAETISLDELTHHFCEYVTSKKHLNYYSVVFNRTLESGSKVPLSVGKIFDVVVSELDYKRAVDNLSNYFFFIGIYEEFIRSSVTLFKYLGISEMKIIKDRIHATPLKPKVSDLPEEIIIALYEKTSFDQRIYDLFKTQL